jgi:hypothetical protein
MVIADGILPFLLSVSTYSYTSAVPRVVEVIKRVFTLVSEARSIVIDLVVADKI